MVAEIYAEYVTHPAIDGGRAYVQLDGKRMALLSPCGRWQRRFNSRRQCVKWMQAVMPDAEIHATNGEMTMNGGTVDGLKID